jgi:3-hydroxyisobutyrate dehydrogenase-like beta-hydroxyacid dehydrogenase
MSELTGFVGLGHMGGALARRLMAAGHSLVVHDRNPQACSEFAAAGARVAKSPRAIADLAPVVFLCLPSIEASLEVAGGLAGGGALQVLVETSTVGPAAMRELASLMAARGVAVVDAPVSGGPRGAQAGTLSLMQAGSKDALARVLPQLSAIATHRFDVGAEPGLAQVCKLVNNAISAAGMVAACEATVVGVKAGLDAGTLLAAINAGSGRNAATLDKFPKAILTGSFDYGGPLGLMLKDLSLFIAEASACGVAGVMAPAALQAWQEAVHRSGFDADYSRLIRHLEIDAGVEVRTAPAAAPP